MKITRDVFMVGGPDLSHDKDACIFLVNGPDRAVLIDAGTGEEIDNILENVQEAGVDPEKINTLILTHCHVDHSGGVSGLKERLRLETVCHVACADILARGNDPRTAASWYGITLPPINMDVAFDEKEYRLDLGDTELVCLHTPGHSPGSIVAYMDRYSERILFGQDVHGPIMPVLGSNPKLYKQSLKLMLDLKADILCEGHFGIYRPASEVEKYIQSFL